MAFEDPLPWIQCPQCAKPITSTLAREYQGFCDEACRDRFENETLKDPRVLAEIDEIEDGRERAYRKLLLYFGCQLAQVAAVVGAVAFGFGLAGLAENWYGQGMVITGAIGGVLMLLVARIVAAYALYTGYRDFLKHVRQPRLWRHLENARFWQRCSSLALALLPVWIVLGPLFGVALAGIGAGAYLFGVLFAAAWMAHCFAEQGCWIYGLLRFADFCAEAAELGRLDRLGHISRRLRWSAHKLLWCVGAYYLMTALFLLVLSLEIFGSYGLSARGMDFLVMIAGWGIFGAILILYIAVLVYLGRLLRPFTEMPGRVLYRKRDYGRFDPPSL